MRSFNCKRCGKCCSNYLPLTSKEIKHLKDLVKEKNIKPIKRLYERECSQTCPFLDNNNNCVIYDDRPLICKEFRCDFKYDSESLLSKEKRKLTDIRKEIFN